MTRQAKEFIAFQRMTDRLLVLSKEELDARVLAYKERAALNPRKRGPKPKNVTTSGVESAVRDGER